MIYRWRTERFVGGLIIGEVKSPDYWKLEEPSDPAKDPVVVEQVLRWAREWCRQNRRMATNLDIKDSVDFVLLADAVRDGKVKP